MHRGEPKAVQFDSVGKTDSVLIQLELWLVFSLGKCRFAVGSNPAVRTIFRRLEKRLVSSPFMLMHKRAYSNDNRVFVLPALN